MKAHHRGFTPLEIRRHRNLPIRPRIRFLTGFTFVELIVVLGLVTFLFAIGLPIISSTYNDYLFTAERDQFTAILRKTRNQAMANLDGAQHGVEITSSSYIIYEGASYASRVASKDEEIARRSAFTITGPSEIVFATLSGQTSTASFTIQYGGKTANISVNSEGTISW